MNKFKDELQFLGFIDYGAVESVDKLKGEKGTDLFSAGLGVTLFDYPIYCQPALIMAGQLKELTSADDKSSRVACQSYFVVLVNVRLA